MPDKYVIEQADLVDVANTIREKADITEQLVWPEGFKNAIEGFSSLNFEVVGGTTQPSNPKEDTIWVNTNTEITGWIFATDEPTDAADGTVWIITGASSIAPIDVVKENVLMVYPNGAKQRVLGDWGDIREAMIYQNGTWKPLRYYLYNQGDTNDDVTGGWLYEDVTWIDGSYALLGTIMSDGSMYLSSSSSRICAMVTRNKIDLRGFNTLKIRFKNISGTNNRACEMMLTTGRNIYDTFVTIITPPLDAGVEQVAKLPLDQYQGEYYVDVHTGNDRSAHVYEVWLE